MFVVDEAGDLVLGCVSTGAALTVLEDSCGEVIGDPYIKSARAAGEDVDVEMIFARWHGRQDSRLVARWRKADSFASLRNDKQRTLWFVQYALEDGLYIGELAGVVEGAG